MYPGKKFIKPVCLSSNFNRASISTSFLQSLNGGVKVQPNDLYEPHFESTRTYPEYEQLVVRLRGYDFVAIEAFQSLAHRTAKRFKFTVEESIAVANKSERIKLFKSNSHIIAGEFDLRLYDRWLRISQIPAIHLPLFALLLQAHAPIGTIITIKEPENSDEEIRYIPDIELKKAQEELRSLDNMSVRKMLGWE